MGPSPLHPYPLALALAFMVCSACAGAFFLRDPGLRVMRLAATINLASAWWAGCQLIGVFAPDATTVTFLARASALGWLFFGPLVLDLFLEASGTRQRAHTTLLTGLYAVASGLLLVTWTTPWMIEGSAPASWGWSTQVGPLLPLSYLITTTGICAAYHVGRPLFRGLAEAERRQLPWVGAAVAVPFTATTVTDAVLPVLGIPFPLLGSMSLAVLGATTVSVVHHFGWLMLTPSGFAAEILAILPDGVALLRGDQRIRTANEGLARLSGYPAEQLLGMHVGELLTWSFESSDFDECDAELEAASGMRIPVSVTSTMLRDRQEHELGRVLVVRDLREVADLRDRLITSARLVAVGELAAGIAHEINNPLAFVRSNLSQLEESCKKVQAEVGALEDAPEGLQETFADAQELLADSLEGVDRAAEIVRGVRSFAHAGGSTREHADLNDILDDVLHVAASQLRGRAEILRDYGTLPLVVCAPQQLKQVFLNLVMNAAQALGEEPGSIRLVTEARDDDVFITVEDDGCGIPPPIMDRIFDPFFTTKKVGEGTGLGLGIAHQIVKDHRGGIDVESTPGRVTRFRVRLPLG